LAKRQVFQQEVAAGTDRPNKQDEQELQRTEHGPVVTESASEMVSSWEREEWPSMTSDALVSLFRHADERGQIRRCSRNRNGQSTPEPQGSTGIGMEDVNSSIKSTYNHSISISFHKRRDLFWEQRC